VYAIDAVAILRGKRTLIGIFTSLRLHGISPVEIRRLRITVVGYKIYVRLCFILFIYFPCASYIVKKLIRVHKNDSSIPWFGQDNAAYDRPIHVNKIKITRTKFIIGYSNAKKLSKPTG